MHRYEICHQLTDGKNPIIYRVSTMQDVARFRNHRQYLGVKNGAAYLHHFNVRGPKVAATGIAAFVGGALLFWGPVAAVAARESIET